MTLLLLLNDRPTNCRLARFGLSNIILQRPWVRDNDERPGRDNLDFSRDAPQGPQPEEITMKKRNRSKTAKELDELAGIPDPANAAEFEALGEADKAKITGYYETHPNPIGMRRLNAAERALVKAEREADRKKMGRPVVGEGSRMIAVSIELGLLREVDAFAKAHGMKRTQLIAQGLRKVIAEGMPDKRRHRKSA
jgi:hypothetical protein